jgi:hypothetical protein
MKDFQLKINPRVKPVFDNYPDSVRHHMQALRELVIETAQATEGIHELEETLKWGEPSYLAKHGSTIRMDWKEKTPTQYALYFKCTSRLVEVFRAKFSRKLRFEGNRAIVFHLHESLPREELKPCIKAALTYHKVKHLPSLGIT